ncbi:tRNA G46 methylase TrmB [Noviherbaspirillum humi]|uniref:tRNA (guanine(46)-N(7))-methyltransferase n=1 Tax=Noviherbaspirillum humi TaxID=1688639 RepID=A0A239CAD5_9BURK|nr:SAM-dependent methyltransferase [Noviherbaspirillum humi]SNS16638.1 tRNA G46 methylase TrmB [Noviherbaspirillum humi]
MYGNSRQISSGQTGVHERLQATVARHAANVFQKPITDYNRRAFDESMAAWRAAGEAPLILDSGCGVGLSTYHLAASHPEHFVIGLDQSLDRLERKRLWPDEVPQNLILIRADAVDYWRLMLTAKVRPAKHFLLYPNPWPKIGHLGRRWHGHAVFPAMVALGGRLECRSNWRIYIDEFAAALRQLGVTALTTESYAPQDTITPFERKYLASGHGLWRCQADLDSR